MLSAVSHFLKLPTVHFDEFVVCHCHALFKTNNNDYKHYNNSTETLLQSYEKLSLQ